MHRPIVFAVGMFIVGLVSAFSINALVICACCSVLYSFFLFSSSTSPYTISFQIFTSLLFISLFAFGTEYGKQIHQKSQTEILAEQLSESANDITENNSKTQSGRSYRITGRVEMITETEKGLKVKLLVQTIGLGDKGSRLSEKEYLILYCDDFEIEYYDTIRFTCEPKFYKNASNEGGFDSKSYYLARNITGYTYPENIELIDVNEVTGFSHIGKLLNEFKEKLSKGIKSIFSNEDEGILIAMMTGERAYMDDDIKSLYQETGFAHILAISGLHISIIGMSLFAFMRKKELSYIMSTLFTILVLCIYSSFSGGQVSCKRAIIMLCISLIAKCIGQKYDSLTALAVAAFTILLNRPHYIYDSSFIMSFSAGLGASIFGGIVNKCELYMEEKDKKHVKSILFSLSIQAALLPAQVEFFNMVCPYSIILNMLLLPLVPILLLSGFISGILANLSPVIGNITGIPAKLVLLLYNKVLKITLSLPGSRLITGHMTVMKWLIVLIVIIAFCYISTIYRKIHVFLTLLPMLVILVPFHSNKVKITQLYVGQGDCCIITCGDVAIAIDGGSSDEKDIYKYIIKPYLLYNGYDSLDYVFLSHADEDHVSGIREYLLGNLNSGTVVFIPNLQEKSEFLEKLDLNIETEHNIMETNNIKQECVVLHELSYKSAVDIDKLRFICLYPDEENNYSSENDTSMVLLMRFNSFSMLFMGDLSESRENEVLANMEELDLNTNVNVLKAGHHGSKSSTGEELLNAVKPEFGIISCGVNNSYGHPSDETLERIESRGVLSLVTAANGQIRIITDGNGRYSVTTFFN